jgi:hypothetical protein
MHTIPHTIAKLCGLLIAAVLFWGCRKEGFTRLMDVELKYRVLPEAARIKIGDTVKIIAWLPYRQYDRAINSTVDISNMEVQSWGSINCLALDSLTTDGAVVKKGGHIFEDYFKVQHTYGSFREYPTNHYIGNMHKNDTAFYFELKLVPKNPWVFMMRPSPARGFMEQARFRIDITPRVVNANYNQRLLQKYMPGVNPSDIDYYFETY